MSSIFYDAVDKEADVGIPSAGPVAVSCYPIDRWDTLIRGVPQLNFPAFLLL
jgi:hypothetical protein